jgi:hypothetical protein
MLRLLMIVVLAFGFNHAARCHAQWSVAWQNAMELDRGGFDIDELSGVTLVNSSATGQGTFMTVSDENGNVGWFDATFDANGVSSTELTSLWELDDDSLDTEGIAFHPSQPDRVLVSYERDTDANPVIPGIRQYDLQGNRLQTLPLPAVWRTNGNTRTNRGFESLTRTIAGGFVWTGNEEALTIDGAQATGTMGTTVRLQQLAFANNMATPAAQFAYEVDPVHGPQPDRSGLVDLVALPDGSLLALERSAAVTNPIIQNRIYQIDFAGATDTGGTLFNNGLVGASYVPVKKTLLWAGAADGGFGANLEGLALGPRTANGNWTLVGVTDNGGGSNGNLVVSFELSPPQRYGDFNQDAVFDCHDIDALVTAIVSGSDPPSFDLNGDGLVDGLDQSAWLAAAALANDLSGPILPGDANLDGAIDGADFVIWNANKFSSQSRWCAGEFDLNGTVDGQDFILWNSNKFATNGALAVPEPSGGSTGLVFMIWIFGRHHRKRPAAMSIIDR